MVTRPSPRGRRSQQGSITGTGLVFVTEFCGFERRDHMENFVLILHCSNCDVAMAAFSKSCDLIMQWRVESGYSSIGSTRACCSSTVAKPAAIA